MAGLGLFGGAECRGSTAHVHIRGKSPIDHWSAQPDQLGQHDPGQRFGVLLGQGTDDSDWCHGASQRERRHCHRLPGLCKLNQALGHRTVEQARRIGVDVANDDRLCWQVFEVDAVNDARHVQPVQRAVTTEQR